MWIVDYVLGATHIVGLATNSPVWVLNGMFVVAHILRIYLSFLKEVKK